MHYLKIQTFSESVIPVKLMIRIKRKETRMVLLLLLIELTFSAVKKKPPQNLTCKAITIQMLNE